MGCGKMSYYFFGTADAYVTGKGYIRLRYIKTSPKNIKLTHISGTVPGSGLLGINAGYFDDSSQDVYSICIQNSSTVTSGHTYNGYYNVTSAGTKARGTLVWDDPWRTYRLQTIEAADEITIGDPDNYWAQGGVNLFLKNDTSWNNLINSPTKGEYISDQSPNAQYNRSALLYGTSLNIYLVISETKCSLDQFRTAIKLGIDTANGIEGIILDGANATQMNVPDSSYSFMGGSSRKLPAMIQVVNNVPL